MNLHGLVRGAITSVNPDVDCTLKASSGYTTAGDGSQVPGYITGGARVQVQALKGEDKKYVDSLNIQGVVRKFFLFGDVEGLDRPFGKGGDLITFDPALTGAGPLIPGTTWLVFTVFESWDVPGWCSVGAVLQNGS